MSTKVTRNDRRTPTGKHAHPFTGADFKRPFGLRAQTVGDQKWHFVTSCLQYVVQLLSDVKVTSIHTPSKAPNFISEWFCANIMSIHFTHFCFYPPAEGWLSSQHTGFVSTSPCFTFTRSHTLLSWELPSITKLLSSSTGADGIKGKGCSAAFVLYYIFFYWVYRCLKWRLIMDRFRLINRIQFKLITEIVLTSAPSFMLHSLCPIHQVLHYQLQMNIQKYL